MTAFGKRLLVPIDGSDRSERVAEIATTVGAATGAEVQLIAVIAADEEREVRERYLDAVASSVVGERPVDLKTVIRKGIRIEKEIEQAIDDETSMVMLTGGTIGPHDGHIGSVAEQVIRATTRPSIVVGPNALASIQGVTRVVVGLDGSPLAERAIPVGCELASLLHAQLWLVTVASPDQVAAATAVGPIIETGYLRRLAGTACPGIDVEYDVLHNVDPAAGILSFLTEFDLPVLSTHGRSGVSRLVAGSVTTAVVRDATRPVAIVPPLYEPDAPESTKGTP